MTYRELSMIEIKEILRLWLEGRSQRDVSRLTSVDRKTVRRYVETARACGVDRNGEIAQLTDELLAAVVGGARPQRPHGRGASWEAMAAPHEQLKACVDELTLTKIHMLLGRRGVVVPYLTLHRYATSELGFRPQAGDGAGGRRRP